MGVFQNNLLAGAAGQAGAGTAAFYDYQIEQSCRWDESPDQLQITSFGQAPTSQYKGSFSCWFKRQGLAEDGIFTCGNGGSDGELNLRFNADGTCRYNLYSGSSQVGTLVTTQVFRDFSAWMHVMVTWDTTDSTSSNRMKMYINGTQVTDFSTEDYPSQNQNAFMFGNSRKHGIGFFTWNGSGHLEGYLAEIHATDGTVYTPSQFGETKNGVWIPKDPSGTSYGNNGFYLKFENASDLGNDSSGNNNDFTPDGLGADHQVLDSPTFGS